jgi:hypothetical protein
MNSKGSSLFDSAEKHAMKTVATLTYTNGDTYEGEIENDTPNGNGKIVWANGDSYDGEWKDGKLNGQGTYTWSDGQYYIGGFKEGQKNGFGKLVSWDSFFSNPGWDDFDSASHISYEGEWKDDKKNGIFKVIMETGNIEYTQVYSDDALIRS